VNKNRGSRIPRSVAFVLAFVAGLAMSLQAHINGELGVALGSGIVAATLSFGGGVIVLGVAALASHRIRSGLRTIRLAIASKQTSWMFTFAGAAGAAFVLSQSTVAPVLGLATFTVAFVCGLTVGGLVMDRLGIGPAGHKPLTLARLAGAFLGVSAVVITSVGSTWTNSVSLGIIVPVICGVGVSWQQAANGRLTAAGQNAWATTLINFSVGFGLLLAAAAIILSVTQPVLDFPANPWLYVGGPVGIVFIAIASIVVREIGILVYGLCATTGQLVSALAFDAFVSSGPTVSVALIAGVVVVAAGASLASLSGRGRR
jgi:transporter family-2 protein